MITQFEKKHSKNKSGVRERITIQLRYGLRNLSFRSSRKHLTQSEIYYLLSVSPDVYRLLFLTYLQCYHWDECKYRIHERIQNSFSGEWVPPHAVFFSGVQSIHRINTCHFEIGNALEYINIASSSVLYIYFLPS